MNFFFRNLTARHGTKIYHYLIYYMDNWQQDFSFRVFLENWLCFIQPWRYDSLDKKWIICLNDNSTLVICINVFIYLFIFIFFWRRYYSSTESEINEKWKMFIVRNLQCYTKLFSIVIKRFLSINICSVQYSMMVLRVLKVSSSSFYSLFNKLKRKKFSYYSSSMILFNDFGFFYF